jgi:hypothetical protein
MRPCQARMDALKLLAWLGSTVYFSNLLCSTCHCQPRLSIWFPFPEQSYVLCIYLVELCSGKFK